MTPAHGPMTAPPRRKPGSRHYACWTGPVECPVPRSGSGGHPALSAAKVRCHQVRHRLRDEEPATRFGGERAQRADRAARALSVAMPVLACICR